MTKCPSRKYWKAAKGERHAFLLGQAKRWRRWDAFGYKEILDRLCILSLQKCEKPKELDELQRIALWVVETYPPGPGEPNDPAA